VTSYLSDKIICLIGMWGDGLGNCEIWHLLGVNPIKQIHKLHRDKKIRWAGRAGWRLTDTGTERWEAILNNPYIGDSGNWIREIRQGYSPDGIHQSVACNPVVPKGKKYIKNRKTEELVEGIDEMVLMFNHYFGCPKKRK
jgi:hypothetical protein